MVGRTSGTQGFAVRRQDRQSRRAVLIRAASGFVFLLTLGGLVWWTLAAGTFAVKRIESGAYRYTSSAELEQVFSQFIGKNIWTLDKDEIEATVARLPWVRDVRVLRSLPNRIQLDFREWTPVLMVETMEIRGVVRDRLVLLEDGRLLDFPAHLVLPALPFLVGVQPARQGDDPTLKLSDEQTSQLMELIFSIEDAGLEAMHPVDFVVARSTGFAIVLQDDQGVLLVGREEFGARLQVYMTAEDHYKSNLFYDLRFENRLTVQED
ncbi:MAG: hypothetical protein ACI9UK_000656 [Candidatus Krumholzibacteriia bacterium]|jgi:cell division septal protein FtsQ